MASSSENRKQVGAPAQTESRYKCDLRGSHESLRYIANKWQALPFSLFIRRSLFYSYFYAVYFTIRLIRRDPDRLYCFPVAPDRPYGLWKCLRLLGVGPVGTPRIDHRLALAHFDATDVKPGQVSPFRAKLDLETFVVNGHCLSISKEIVERRFEEIFGEALHIDPTTFVGQGVKKSKRNSAHDGEIITFPVPLEEISPHCVYQRLIDNDWDEVYTRDYRVMIVGDEIPFVAILWRRREFRFGQCPAERARFSQPERLFSQEEQERFLNLARAMGVDFGLLDVLRSNSSGRIYVVDVNHTPHLPPPATENWRGIRAMHCMAQAFHRQFLERRYSRMQEVQTEQVSCAASLAMVKDGMPSAHGV